MPTPHFLRLLALSPALVAGAFATTLTGTQSAPVVTLEKGSHALKGPYVVPAGKKLELKAGAMITVEHGAAITVGGELVVSGEPTSPVVFKGNKWRGIRTEESATVSIAGLQITGADTALDVQGPLKKMDSCVFFKNTRGVKLDGKGDIAVTNSLLSENSEYGLKFSRVGGTVDHCSFIKNKGFGATTDDNNPHFTACYFQDNGAGIEQSNASGASGMKGEGCSFEGKGFAVQSSVSHGSIEFTKCWWGEKSTALLKAKGDKAILPNVKDARAGSGSLKVYWAGFLTAAPKDAGAKVTNKL